MLSHGLNALLRLAFRERHVGPTNPSFPLTCDDARARLAALDRRPLARPLLVLGGIFEFGIGPIGFARRVRRYAAGPIAPIVFFDCLSLDQCAERARRVVERRFGRAASVDVVGQSMGGLVGVLAGIDGLRIGTLFTVASPLRGARMAARMPVDLWPLQAQMRPGAATYARLAASPPSHRVVSYIRLGDVTIGEANAALPGGELWWLDNPRPDLAHVGSLSDPRILLDVLLRLRGETPATTEPPAPLPGAVAQPTTRVAPTLSTCSPTT